MPAQAHTRAELDEWVVAWVVEADIGFTPTMAAEFEDMTTRHPYYFDPQPVRTSQGRRSRWTGPVNVEQWRPLVAKYFAPDLVDQAMCILAHESKGNPGAKNPRSSAAGLFQFLRKTWNSVPTSITGGSYDSGAVYLPEPNVAAAAWLQRRVSSWRPWTVSSLC